MHTRPTTRKVRFVSEHHSTHLLRADWELAQKVDAGEREDADRACAVRLAARRRRRALGLRQGRADARAHRAVIAAARKLGKPVVVDPKGIDFAIYRGATLITPNRKELAEATRRPAETEAEIAAAAVELARTVDSEAVLVTRSEAGMTLVRAGAAPVHVPAYPVKVRDVSGAGDTVAAVLAAMLAMEAGFEAAMRAANAAAAVVVGKRGTATVSAAELRARILPAASRAPEEKIVFDWSVLDERLADGGGRAYASASPMAASTFSIPATSRCLAGARAACDRLVVGLNSDASARRLKGDGRPVQDEHARAEVLAALEAVDLVVVFDEDTPLELIRRVRPQTCWSKAPTTARSRWSVARSSKPTAAR